MASVARQTVHWAEASMEALGLGLFMISAGFTATLLEHDGSLLAVLMSPFARRVVMGVVMGCTAVALIVSPWGRRSGAHINPAVTLTFLRLGRVTVPDALAYVAAQFIGGALGVWFDLALLGESFEKPPVNAVATLPGAAGLAVAFAAETLISFVLMSTVLALGRSERTGRFTPLVAGALVCLFIVVEAPLSGMSMNPARTFASSLGAHDFTALWLYFTAPLVGMFLAAEVHRRFSPSGCAKLLHQQPCHFCDSARAVTPAVQEEQT